MGGLPKQHWPGLFISMAALLCGCNKDDAERLARVGRVAAAKAEAFAEDPEGRWTRGWRAVRGGWDEATLDARVSVRLHWDKELTDTPIQVKVTGAAVELQGVVRDLAQRRRAVAIAETTTGVDKVTDSLEGPSPEP